MIYYYHIMSKVGNNMAEQKTSRKALRTQKRSKNIRGALGKQKS